VELNNPKLKQYLDNGFWRVEGYCMVDVFRAVDLIDSAGKNTQGGVMEIGVHHGKFYMMLNALTSADDQSYAVDVFENQELNIDNSGKGSKDLFVSNLANVDIHQGTNTLVIQGDSTDPKLDLINKIGAGTLRYISIDGGHTPEHTLNDLKLANQLIANEGVVILDDILHHSWLGVMEGAVKFLQSSPTLIPFAIGHNKLYMCKLSYHEFYYNLFLSSGLAIKTQKYFGYPLVALK
jgi:hypothetical protein